MKQSEPEPRAHQFPKTKWHLVRAGAASPEALKKLCEDYYEPLRAFARRIERDPARADDVVQGFLTRILEHKVVDKADEARGRFRTFLRKALRNYAINVYHAENRPGGLDDSECDALASESPSADRLYDRAWARALLNRALDRLRDEQMARADSAVMFEALHERLEGDDDGSTLREVATRIGKSEVAVKVALFRMRKRYFDLVRAEVSATVPGPEDVEPELRSLRAALRDET